MKISNKGLDLIKKFEGYSDIPYLCAAGKPTISYGLTHYPNGKQVTMKDSKITKEKGDELFKTIADKFGLAVSKCLKKEVNQNQFNALVSFAYNVGVANFMNSTLLKKVNVDPNDETIFDEFCRWNKVGKKEVTGLTKRRNYEAVSYFS
jgi:lysozyme